MLESINMTTGEAITSGPGTEATNISGTASVPTMPQETSSAPDFESMVPAEYKELGWVQDLVKSDDPWGNLFKQNANAQAMIGKKTAGVEIPGEGASEDSVKAFRKALGVPDNADGYEYKAPDLSKEPEEVQKFFENSSKNNSFLTAMKAKALNVGLTPKQFQELASAVDELQLAELKTQVEAAKSAEDVRVTEQRKKFSEIYGDKAPIVEKQAKEVAQKIFKDFSATKDPEILLFEAMRWIHQNMFSNGTVQASGQGAPSMTVEQMQAAIFEKRARPEFSDPFKAGHKALNAEIDQMYIQLEEMKKAKK